MDGDDTPGTLNAELLEEGGSHESGGGCEGVWVQQGSTNDADENDGKPAAEDLRTVSDHGTAGHSTQVRHNLGHGYSIGGEIVLIGEERGV